MKLPSAASLALLSLFATAACGTISGADASRAAALAAQKTAEVVHKGAGEAVDLRYALFNVSNTDDATKKYAMTVSSYSVCGWGLAQGWTGHPNRARLLAVYLLNLRNGAVAAPVAGTYQVQTPGSGATGLFVDPAVSGFGIFGDTCSGTWPGLASGTVTLTAADADRGILEGRIDLVLGDGSVLAGPLTTAVCTGIESDGTDGKSTDCQW